MPPVDEYGVPILTAPQTSGGQQVDEYGVPILSASTPQPSQSQQTQQGWNPLKGGLPPGVTLFEPEIMQQDNTAVQEPFIFDPYSKALEQIKNGTATIPGKQSGEGAWSNIEEDAKPPVLTTATTGQGQAPVKEGGENFTKTIDGRIIPIESPEYNESGELINKAPVIPQLYVGATPVQPQQQQSSTPQEQPVLATRTQGEIDAEKLSAMQSLSDLLATQKSNKMLGREDDPALTKRINDIKSIHNKLSKEIASDAQTSDEMKQTALQMDAEILNKKYGYTNITADKLAGQTDDEVNKLLPMFPTTSQTQVSDHLRKIKATRPEEWAQIKSKLESGNESDVQHELYAITQDALAIDINKVTKDAEILKSRGDSEGFNNKLQQYNQLHQSYKESIKRYPIVNEEAIKQAEHEQWIIDNPIAGTVTESVKGVYNLIPKTVGSMLQTANSLKNIIQATTGGDPNRHDETDAWVDARLKDLDETFTTTTSEKSIFQDGEINPYAIVPGITEGIAQMYLLMAGGRLAAPTLANKTLANNIGLVVSGYLTTYGDYYNTAKAARKPDGSKLTEMEAITFANGAAGLTSVLELINPNFKILPTQSSAIAKTLLEQIAAGVKPTAWSAVKNVLKENTQEMLQTVGDKAVGALANINLGENTFDTGVSMDEVKETIVLTTLITAIAGKFGAGFQKEQRNLAQIKLAHQFTSNPQPIIDAVNAQVSNGVITKKQAADLLDNVQGYAGIIASMPKGKTEQEQAAIIPVIEEKKTIEEKKASLEEEKKKLDSAYHQEQNEKIKKEQEKIDALNAQIIAGGDPAYTLDDAGKTEEIELTPTVTTDNTTTETTTQTLPKEGDMIELPAQVQGGLPQSMIYSNGGWKARVGNVVSVVGTTKQQQAQDAWSAKNPQPESKPITLFHGSKKDGKSEVAEVSKTFTNVLTIDNTVEGWLQERADGGDKKAQEILDSGNKYMESQPYIQELFGSNDAVQFTNKGKNKKGDFPAEYFDTKEGRFYSTDAKHAKVAYATNDRSAKYKKPKEEATTPLTTEEYNAEKKKLDDEYAAEYDKLPDDVDSAELDAKFDDRYDALEKRKPKETTKAGSGGVVGGDVEATANVLGKVDKTYLVNEFIKNPSKFVKAFIGSDNFIKLSLAVGKLKGDLIANYNETHKNLRVIVDGLDMSKEVKDLIYPSDIEALINNQKEFLTKLEKRVNQRKNKALNQKDYSNPYGRTRITGLTPLKVARDFESNPNTKFNLTQYEFAKAELDLQLINYIENGELELNTSKIKSKNELRNELSNLTSNGLSGENLINSISIKSIQNYVNKFWDGNYKSIAESYHKAKADGTNPELVKAVEQSLKETPKAGSGGVAGDVPIRQLGTGANVYFETDKYRVNDNLKSGKVLLNVGDAKGESPLANIEFDTTSEAVFVAKKLQENAPEGLVSDYHNVDKVIENYKDEYKQSLKETPKAETPKAGSVGVVDATAKALKKLDDNGELNKIFIEKEISIDDIAEESADGQKLSDAIVNVKDGLKSKTNGKILVYESGGKYYIADGFHRVAEAKLKGDKSIQADVVYAKPKDIAEAYHKAKADGTNPELVKAVEQSLKETKKVEAPIPDVPLVENVTEPEVVTEEVVTEAEATKEEEKTKEEEPVETESGEFVIHGTFSGHETIAGNDAYASDALRQESVESLTDGESKIVEFVRKGKKVFSIITPNRDRVGRVGYVSVALVLPETTKKTIEDVRPILEKKQKEVLDALANPNAKKFNLHPKDLVKDVDLTFGKKESVTKEQKKQEEVIDNTIDENLTAEDNTVIESEMAAEPTVEGAPKKTKYQFIREKVSDYLAGKQIGHRLRKIVSKIAKAIRNLIIAGSIVTSVHSTSVDAKGIHFDMNKGIISILDTYAPQEQGEWAKRVLDKKGLIEIADAIIVEDDSPAPVQQEVVKENEAPKVQKFFQIIGTVPDSYNPSDSLMSYRSQWDNKDGFRYIPLPTRIGFKGAPIKVSGVVGVGHFMLDGSVANKTPYAHQYDAKFMRNAIKNNDYIPVFKINEDGSVTVKYKRAKELTKSDLTITPLRQMTWGDIDFSKTGKAPGFKSSIKEIKKTDGKGTYLIFKDRSGYSRFSGGSVVFIFKDKSGNTIVRDFAGSLNGIEREGLGIIKDYGIDPKDLTIGYHDVGSFSAKPKAHDGTISTDQYKGFNNDDWTGGALLIPIEGNVPAKGSKSAETILGMSLLGAGLGGRKKKSLQPKITTTKNEDNEHTVFLDGKEIGKMYYDPSQKTWQNSDFSKSSERAHTFKWIYGDILGESKQEAIDKLIERAKESAPKEESQEITFSKDPILNKFLNSLHKKAPLQLSGVARNEFVYGEKAALEFSRFDKGTKNEIELKDIAVFDKATGVGKSVMKDITDVADELGIRLTLHAKPFGNDPKALNKKNLVKFYQKNGFKIDLESAYSGEFKTDEALMKYVVKWDSEGVEMVREPQVSAQNKSWGDQAVEAYRKANPGANPEGAKSSGLSGDEKIIRAAANVAQEVWDVTKSVAKAVKAFLAHLNEKYPAWYDKRKNTMKDFAVKHFSAIAAKEKDEANTTRGMLEQEKINAAEIEKLKAQHEKQLDRIGTFNTTLRDKMIAKQAKEMEALKKRQPYTQKNVDYAFRIGEAFGQLGGEIFGKAEGRKEGVKEEKARQKEFADKISKVIKDAELNGEITATQAKALARRAAGVGTSKIKFDNFVKYAMKVVEDVEYDADVTEANKLKKAVKRVAHNSNLPFVKEFLAVKHDELPPVWLKAYNEALKDMAKKVPDYREAELILNNVKALSQVSPKQFDAVKTHADAQQKLIDIFANPVTDVSEYRELIANIREFKKKVNDLFNNGAITDVEHQQLMDNIYDADGKVVAAIKDKVDILKDELIAEVRNTVYDHADFNEQELTLIKEFEKLKDKDLKGVSAIALGDLVEITDRMSRGELPTTQLTDVVNSITSSKNAPLILEQLKLVRNKNIDYKALVKKLLTEGTGYVQKILGVARRDDIEKYIFSPISRAINAYKQTTDHLVEQYEKALNPNKGLLPKTIKEYNIAVNKVGMVLHILQERALKNLTEKNVLMSPDRAGERDTYGAQFGNEAELQHYTDEQKELLGRQRYDYDPRNIKIDKDGNVTGLLKDIYKELLDKFGKDVAITNETTGVTTTGRILDVEAIYQDIQSGGNNIFTAKEKSVYEAYTKLRESLLPMQEVANAKSGKDFNPVEDYAMRYPLGSNVKAKDANISKLTSGDIDSVIGIESSTGKQRITNDPYAMETNIEALGLIGIKKSAINFHIKSVNDTVNETINKAIKNGTANEKNILNAVKEKKDQVIKHEFTTARIGWLLKNLQNAKAVRSLTRVARAAAEIITTVPTTMIRMLNGKALVELDKIPSRKIMMDIMKDTNSPLLDKATFIGDRNFDMRGAQDAREKGLSIKISHAVNGAAEAITMPITWMPVFESSFREITGQEFNEHKYNNNPSYKKEFAQEIDDAAAVADNRAKMVFGTSNKGDERQLIKVTPFGHTVKSSTFLGSTLGFFANYPYRDTTALIHGLRQVVNAQNGSSVAGAREAFGAALNIGMYGIVAGYTRALLNSLIGSDDDKERAAEYFEAIKTKDYWTSEGLGDIISGLSSRYSGGGRIAAVSLLSTLRAIMKDRGDNNAVIAIDNVLDQQYYTKPLRWNISGDNKETRYMLMYGANVIPSLGYILEMGEKEGVNISNVYKKVMDGEKITGKEEEIYLLLNLALTTTNIITGVMSGTQVPFSKDIELMIKQKDEPSGTTRKLTLEKATAGMDKKTKKEFIKMRNMEKLLEKAAKNNEPKEPE